MRQLVLTGWSLAGRVALPNTLITLRKRTLPIIVTVNILVFRGVSLCAAEIEEPGTAKGLPY